MSGGATQSAVGAFSYMVGLGRYAWAVKPGRIRMQLRNTGAENNLIEYMGGENKEVKKPDKNA